MSIKYLNFLVVSPRAVVTTKRRDVKNPSTHIAPTLVHNRPRHNEAHDRPGSRRPKFMTWQTWASILKSWKKRSSTLNSWERACISTFSSRLGRTRTRAGPASCAWTLPSQVQKRPLRASIPTRTASASTLHLSSWTAWRGTGAICFPARGFPPATWCQRWRGSWD